MDELWHLPVLALPPYAAVMAFAWLRQRRTRNAGIVDVLWAGGLGVLAVTFATLAEGWAPRRLLVGLLAGLWSARLTLLLARRVATESEDGRYAILRTRWGDRFEPWLFLFFQAQALLAVLLSLAFLIPAAAETAGWRWNDFAAIALWVLSIAGESLADRQLHDWRSDPANRGKTCRTGLWATSRHPNYFFEWLH